MANDVAPFLIKKIKYLFIHCTAESMNPNASNFDADVSHWDKLHRSEDFKFRPVCVDGKKMYFGYHYLIHKDGTIEKGRPDTDAGQQTSGFNQYSLGIAISGNGKGKLKNNRKDFWDAPNGVHDVATTQQVTALKQLIKKLIAEHGLSINDVRAHHDSYKMLGKEKMKKTCPTFSVRKFMTGEFLTGNPADGEYYEYEYNSVGTK